MSKRYRSWACLALLLALSLLLRWPQLANADVILNSDEAVNALTLLHLVRDGEWTLFNWDTRYYGLTEGLLTIPFVPLLGWQAVALKLGALAGLWLFAAVLFFWIERLWGLPAAVAGAALPLFVSQQASYWSLLAAGGYFLTCALGTLALERLSRHLESADSAAGRRCLWLGFLLGFGLYTYQLFLVFLLTVLGALAVASLARRRPPSGRELLALAVGFGIGWAPYVIGILTSPSPGWAPSFSLANLEIFLGNARILVEQALPALLGLWDPAGRAGLRSDALPRAAILLLAMGALVAEAGRRGGGAARLSGRLALLLLALNLLLFVGGRAPQDWSSNRYLLPLVASLALGVGALVSLAERRHAGLGLAVAVALTALLFTARAVDTLHSGFVGPRLEVLAVKEPLRDVLAELEARGVRDAYAPYWIAFKATFLAGERIVFDAVDWPKYRGYSRRVDRSPSPAWVFPLSSTAMDATREAEHERARQRFESRLANAGVDALIVDRPPYRIYLSPAGKRLLPPPIRDPLRPLSRPQAEITILESPRVARPGEGFRVRVEIANRSDGFWSTTGDALRAGLWQVNLSYRWLREDGTVEIVEGTRSAIPWDLPVDGRLRSAMDVVAPSRSGPHVLRVTLVQEGVAWFDQATGSFAETLVSVVGGPP